MMDVRTEAAAFLKVHEGTGPMVHGRHGLYDDGLGNWTIGYGRNLSGIGISRPEANILLANDMTLVIEDLETFPWFATTDPARQVALIDWRFNLGPTRFRRWGATLTLIAERKYVAAAAQFRSNRRYFAQVGNRAEWIARVIETGQL